MKVLTHKKPLLEGLDLVKGRRVKAHLSTDTERR